jgi:HAMP domain-containing protein
MATLNSQEQDAFATRGDAREWFEREVGKWYKSVIRSWKPGNNTVSSADQDKLEAILRRGYDAISLDVLDTDYRRFKQDELVPFNEAMTATADELDDIYEQQAKISAAAIVATTAIMMAFATTTAEEATEVAGRARDTIAKRGMARRGRNHSLIIALTEGNWGTQSTRSTAILSVNDPLHDSVEEIARLIAAGEENAARRLSRQVFRLSRLPTSVKQGQVISFVNDQRDRLLTPETQGRIVAGLREQAERLGVPVKEWASVLISTTRDTHRSADGQQRPADQPFDVGGEKLQYPMDTSLGASAGNIVNCLCSVLWQ